MYNLINNKNTINYLLNYKYNEKYVSIVFMDQLKFFFKLTKKKCKNFSKVVTLLSFFLLFKGNFINIKINNILVQMVISFNNKKLSALYLHNFWKEIIASRRLKFFYAFSNIFVCKFKGFIYSFYKYSKFIPNYYHRHLLIAEKSFFELALYIFCIISRSMNNLLVYHQIKFMLKYYFFDCFLKKQYFDTQKHITVINNTI